MMRFEVRPSFGFFLLAFILTSCRAVGWPLGIWAGLLISASVLLHEFGHASVAFACGVRVKRLGATYKGAYLVREYAATRLAETLITLAGPAVNLLLCLTSFLLLPETFGWWVAFMNLVLAFFNLIPVGPSDGARLWRPRCTMLPATELRKAA